MAHGCPRSLRQIGGLQRRTAAAAGSARRRTRTVSPRPGPGRQTQASNCQRDRISCAPYSIRTWPYLTFIKSLKNMARIPLNNQRSRAE